MRDLSCKQKILVVDDEVQLAGLVSFHMKMAGFDVITALDGKKALELSLCEKPDLIILDLMIPEIDGWQVCERLKRGAATKNIAVTMLSARAEIEDKLKGFEAGADDYVTKPFSPGELVARVKRILTGSPKGEVSGKSRVGGDPAAPQDTKDIIRESDRREF